MAFGVFFDLGQDSIIWDGLSMIALLPVWLVAARDPDRLRDVLSQTIPQFARGKLLLQKCEVDHISYKNDHWTGFYHLITSLPGEQRLHTTDLVGEIYTPGMIMPGEMQVTGDFGAEGWQAVIPELNLKLKEKESEKVLASLAFLTDPEQSCEYLTSSIRSGSAKYHDLKIRASHPNIVRYKPGSRCTIIYQLEYAQSASPETHWPERVVAKTYRGVKGKNAFDSMAALCNSSLGSSSVVNIAEPLAYDEQERVLIQRAIPEEKTLKNVLHSALQHQAPETMQALHTTLQKTAAGLAELHQCGVDLGKTWRWEDEMEEIRERVESLSTAYPVLARGIEPLLDRLIQLAVAVPPDPVVPSHGSFRPSQVLIYQDQIGFIDFDSFCQSEPANDLALFLSTLMVNSTANYAIDEEQDSDAATAPLAAGLDAETREARYELASALREKFLDAYEQHHPVSRQRVALWETLDILMLILHYWIKVKPAELTEILYLLERFLQANHFVEKS